jgi:small subunit ribosomal protein S8
MITDLIADMLTRIRNACWAGHESTSVKWSKINWNIALLLQREGYIDGCIEPDGEPPREFTVRLRYRNGRPAIEEIHRESCPSCRVYRKAKDVALVRNGHGTGIYSTSKGLLTDKEARERNLGGEYIASVW